MNAKEAAIMRPFFATKKSLALLIAGLVSLYAVAAGQEHPDAHPADAEHSWSYSGATGPEHWGDLSPEFAVCKTGKQESPIDINHAQSADLPPIQITSRPVPLKIINTGHYIRQSYAPNNGNSFTVGDQTYELTQFHFHHPSEETLHGKHYAMVAHFVYQNKEGHYAVIAVLIKEGRPNPLITTLWNNFPSKMDEEHDADAVQVNGIELMPTKRSYYKYEGSLTTPPCTEGIVFFVLDTPISLSKEQIAMFAKYYPNDARPTQPLNGRIVQHSK